MRRPAQLADLGELRPAGEHDQPRVDPSPACLDRHATAAGRQAAEGDVLADLDAAADQRHRVGSDVARRRDETVLGAEGAAERLPGRERRVGRVHFAGIEPAHRDAQRGLHRHPLVRRRDLRLGEAGQQIALLGEPGVGADLVALAQVELAGPLTQAHRLRRPALHPDHAGRPAARPLAEEALLDQDDPRQSGLPQEVRAPGAHRPAAHHHGIRDRVSHAHRLPGSRRPAYADVILVGTGSMLT